MFLYKSISSLFCEVYYTLLYLLFYFRLYLGMQPSVSSWSNSGDEFSLVWEQCPISEWVELPQEVRGLKYCNLLCGALRGALEMVQLEIHSWFVQVTFNSVLS